MAQSDVFWLGPAGGLRALPSPSLDGPPEMVPVRTGGTHRSLTGRPTLDRLGIRRTWTLTWPYLDPDTRSWLSALYAGLVPGPLWLLDPSDRNRLPVQVATAGAVEHTADGFTASTGTLAWQAAPVVPTGTSTPLGASALVWTATAASGGTMVTLDPVPVMPDEVVTFAASLAATVAVRLTAFVLDASGATLTTAQSPAATPGASGARMSLAIPATAGAALIRPGLALAQAGAITTSAWSLTTGDTAPTWSTGGGASTVLLDQLPWKYPIPGAFSTTLVLLEV
ncbi:hypothetical protein [Amycolatopsis sp. MtRt-6]|uniref:hypothetical protein n=1 Tax=Amycolatopsis sp. MtRt-6 TaxID=2792782 RepID=UPI001A90310C|nr:hypothetical protein [Amycolatopsis sp. MtRt-6]